MRQSWKLASVAAGLLSLTIAGSLHAQAPAAAAPTDAARAALPGHDVFEANCSLCHAHGLMNAPPVSTLNTYPAARILTALTTGVMKTQGAKLSDEERDQVIEYLAAPAGAAAPATTAAPAL